jgi:GT2 family glycosyltransferase
MSSEGKGYLFARNYFLQSTCAEYYCSLDDDSWFLDSFDLSKAVKYMDENSSVAALSFSILSRDDGGKFRGGEISETNNFIGCGHLLRVSAVKAVGYYTENPGFYGGEEKDLCIKLMDRGFFIMHFPAVKIWHDKTNISRDILRQYQSNVCNDLVFGFRRVPSLILIPILVYKVFSHFRFSLSSNFLYLKPCILGIRDFLKFLFSGKTNRKPVAMSTYKKFKKLN